MTFSEAYDRWITKRVANRSLAASSVPSYQRAGKTWTGVVGNKAPHNVTFADADRWAESLGHLAAGTQAGRISILATFFDSLIRAEELEVNPLSRLDKPKVGRRAPRPAPVSGMARTLEVANPKARLMIRLATRLALRRFEIAKLRRCDFDWDEMLLHVTGKGGKQAILPLPTDIAAEVRTWCDANYVAADGYLFPSNRKHGAAMSAQRVGDIITEASWVAGEHITPHTYRHRAATDMNRAYGLKAAQRLLRHSSSATTDIYAQFDVEDLRGPVESLGGEAA
jgi:site-specific recombinase XerD